MNFILEQNPDTRNLDGKLPQGELAGMSLIICSEQHICI